MSESPEHYLMRELYSLVRTDPAIFDFLQEGSLDGLWYWDIEHPEIEWMSPRFWRVLGYDPAQMRHLSSEWQHLIDPDDLRLALENFHAHCANASHPYDQVVRYKHADGSTVWVRCRGIAIRDASGKAVRMLGAHNDITGLKSIEVELQKQADELRRVNAELARAATRDSLTNLYNRRAFDEHFEWSLNNARRRGECVSVMLIDLDHFKLMNDTYGHDGGDAALVSVAGVLRDALRETDFPARFGGEEFAVALPRTDQHGGLAVGEAVRRAIAGARHEHSVTASVGLATVVPQDQDDIPRLAAEALKQADRALYAAKAQGRNRVCHFATA